MGRIGQKGEIGGCLVQISTNLRRKAGTGICQNFPIGEVPGRTQNQSRSVRLMITSPAAFGAGGRCTATDDALQLPPKFAVA